VKFEDKTRFGPSAEVIANLKDLRLQLAKVASNVQPTDRNDYLRFAFGNIAMYCSSQTDLLITHHDSPIQTIAWIARNLFECYLLCEYVTTDPVKAEEFVVQKASDELDINEGFITLAEPGTAGNNLQLIQDRNDHIRSTLNKHGIKETGHWTVGMLAERTGKKGEYNAFFKLYSKYVHPSSWLINGKSEEYDTDVYRNVFFLQAQFYVGCILKIAPQYSGSQD
jgi:hypothetical protein